MLRVGSGEPLVLFHGVMGSERHWLEVAPLLAGEYDVIALTALGHRGGPAPRERPVTFTAVVDQAERQLDDLSLERAHMAGNSMGGWMALAGRPGACAKRWRWGVSPGPSCRSYCAAGCSGASGCGAYRWTVGVNLASGRSS